MAVAEAWHPVCEECGASAGAGCGSWSNTVQQAETQGFRRVRRGWRVAHLCPEHVSTTTGTLVARAKKPQTSRRGGA